MFKRTLLVQACALVLFTPTSNAETCLHKSYEYIEDAELQNISSPILNIERQDYMPILSSGQSVDFKLVPTLAINDNNISYFPCISNTGFSSENGTLTFITPDQIRFSAPSQIQSDQVIRIFVQASNSQGLVGGDNFYIQLKASTTISGQLLDSNGKPIVGATITVGDKTATTDSNGNYRISGLPLGTYTVTVSKESYSFSPTQVTLEGSNTGSKLDLTGIFTGKVAQVAVGAHSCQDNSNQILTIDDSGQTTTSITSLFEQSSTIKADLNNDSLQETISFLTNPSNSNILIFDNKNQPLASLSLTLNGESITNNLPKVLGTIFIEQGKTILAIVNAEGSEHQVALYNIDKDFKVTFIKNFTPFNTVDVRRKNEKVTICHNGKELDIASSAVSAHLNHGDTLGSCPIIDNKKGLCQLNGEAGLLISSHTKDSKSIILIAQNGGKEIYAFNSNGNLLQTHPLPDPNSVISSLANINLNLPIISSLPDGTLKNVVIIGENPEQPLEVEDREIDSNVHFENVVIGKITITINTNITFGQNVRFKHKDYIPKGINLGNILSKIQQPLKKVKKLPPAINLTQSIVINAPTILQQIQAKFPNIQQDQITGHLVLENGDQRFSLKPVKIKQGDGAKEKGFGTEGIKIIFVTEEDHEVEMIPTMEEVEQLSDTLEQGGIGEVEATDSGQITASLMKAPDQVSYAGVPEMFSTPVDESTPEGLQPADAPNLMQGNNLLRALIFKDKHGKKRKQMIYPYFGQSEIGQIELGGAVSFPFNNVTYRGMLDYSVIFGTNHNGLFDVQPKGDGNFIISYPSGKQQTFYPFK